MIRHGRCSDLKKPHQDQDHHQDQQHHHPPKPSDGGVSPGLMQCFTFWLKPVLARITGSHRRPHELGAASPPPWAGRLRDRSAAGTAGNYHTRPWPESSRSGWGPALATTNTTTQERLDPQAWCDDAATRWQSFFGVDLRERL